MRQKRSRSRPPIHAVRPGAARARSFRFSVAQYTASYLFFEHDDLTFSALEVLALNREFIDRLHILTRLLEEGFERIFATQVAVVHWDDCLGLERNRKFVGLFVVEDTIAADREHQNIDIIELLFGIRRELSRTLGT